MNKNLTELIFILDKSGSMRGMEEDTIGGFNSMLEKQKKVEGEAFVSTYMFSNKCELVTDRVNLKEVTPLTKNEYLVGGGTALLDAIGEAINHISNIHKYARKEDVPKKTLFLITTDGMENASINYDLNQVKQMIKNLEKAKGWKFIFMAANIDAVKTGFSMGIKRAYNYNFSKEGINDCYCMMNEEILLSRKDNSKK